MRVKPRVRQKHAFSNNLSLSKLDYSMCVNSLVLFGCNQSYEESVSLDQLWIDVGTTSENRHCAQVEVDENVACYMEQSQPT